jgi:hypothetical protein
MSASLKKSSININLESLGKYTVAFTIIIYLLSKMVSVPEH